MEKTYKCGIYLRLSKDDGVKGDSNSIINQRKIINDFISNDDSLVFDSEYIDDGFSGSNFDRPAFLKMVNDIEQGVINCVIVKDLSRFGRDFVGVGFYTETFFVKYNIRFIAILDNTDTITRVDDSFMRNIRNLINDEYSRDISRKIKKSYKSLQSEGCVVGVVPYGYKKGDNKHSLVVDETASQVVKYIFELKLQELSYVAIAKRLTEEKCVTPKVYKSGDVDSHNKYFWHDSTVKNILNNPIYLGHAVGNRYTKVSHKSKTSKATDKDEWIIVNNTHIPLVSEQDYNKVQEILKRTPKGKNSEAKSPNILQGYFKCGDCKSTMTKKNKTKKRDGYYTCSRHKKNTLYCTTHHVSEKVIEKVILQTVIKYIDIVCDIDELITISKSQKNSRDITNLKQKISELKKFNKELVKNKESLLTKLAKDIITDDEYLSAKATLNSEILANEEKINNLNLLLSTESDNVDFINLFKKFKESTKLTRELITELIDDIYIFEDKSIEIAFKHTDTFSEVLESIER